MASSLTLDARPIKWITKALLFSILLYHLAHLPELWAYLNLQVRSFAVYWNFVAYALAGAGCAMMIEWIYLPSRSTLKEWICHVPSPSARVDLLYFFSMILGLMRPVQLLFFLFFYFLSHQWSWPFPQIDWSDVGVWKWPLLFYLREFFDYWLHRCQHKISWMWEFHRVHHQARELNVLTLFRVHPGDSLGEAAVKGIPLALLGVNLESFLALSLFEQFVHYLHHTRLSWSWGWFGKYIIIPPVAHRLHHAQRKDLHDKNLGSLTPLFDHLFGTWDGRAIELDEIGTEDDRQMSGSFLKSLFTPVANFYRNLFR